MTVVSILGMLKKDNRYLWEAVCKVASGMARNFMCYDMSLQIK